MTKGEAIQELLRDYTINKRRSKTSYRRVLSAIAKLGLTELEAVPLLFDMGYQDTYGAPYPRYSGAKK